MQEDLYRANFNLGSIHFRNGQYSLAIRCFEKSKESARKRNDKFSESECFYIIGKVRDKSLAISQYYIYSCDFKRRRELWWGITEKN